MPHFFKSIKLKKIELILLIFLVISLGVIFPRGFAQASFGSWIGSFLLSFISLIFYAFASIGTYLMDLGGKILAFVITTSFNKDLFLGAPFVKVAWGFTRDFANLFFILWLVIIALATILDVRDYQAKRLLARLIVVALLVNFSLVLCGFMLDIAQGVMGFFNQSMIKIEGKPYSLAEGLVYAFRHAGLFGLKTPGMGQFFGGQLNASINTVTMNFLVMIFSFVGAYVFIVLSVMLLVRIVALWLLLIFAPLAWVFGIMPFARNAFNSWMRQFWQWAFYGVVASFYIYLAAMSVWAIDKAAGWKNFSAQGSNIVGLSTNVPFLNNFSSILSYLVVMILLMMAAGQGKKEAARGGDVLTGAVAGFIGGKAAAWSKKPFSWANRKTRETSKALYEEGKTRAKGRIGGVLMRTRIPRVLGGGLIANKGAQWKVERERAREKRKEKAPDYSRLSKEEQIQLASQLHGLKLEKLMETMIKNNTIQQLDKNNPRHYETLKNMYAQAKKSGNEKLLEDFEVKRLDMVTDISQMQTPQQTIEAERRREEAIRRAVKSGEFKNWTKQFVNSLSEEQMAELMKNKDAAKAIGKAAEDWTQDVKDGVLEKIKAGFSEEFDKNIDRGKQNIALRNTYARISGNYHKAFEADTTGWTPQQIENREKVLRESIASIKGQKDWEKVDTSDDNIREIAKYIQTSQLANAGRYLDSNTKEKIYDHLGDMLANEPTNVHHKQVYEDMMSHDLWPGSWDKQAFETKRREGIKEGQERIKQQKAEEQRQRERRIKARKLRQRRRKILEERRKRDEARGEGPDETGSVSRPGSNQPAGPAGSGGRQGGSTRTEPSKSGPTTFKARNVTIETEEPPEIKGGGEYTVNLNRPVVSTTEEKNPPQVVRLEPKPKTEKGEIVTPEPRGHIKFSEGPGLTPQQRKDFEEKRRRKLEEALERKKTEGNEENISRAE